jgi:hypothetical protein
MYLCIYFFIFGADLKQQRTDLVSVTKRNNIPVVI